ncbi:SDR family oxidoreductase [Amycolatopsis sp.]|jgi:NAD(P)-dependent dehydrogenase (short-subunit alcohol dehydrogenase family)|uniref:SDR family NAD(P)-dependent oxidoreductase n=1 Tax=Amycolatopsis sp. TaxID=37632 RepID=UPI002DFCF2A3|nr:SDR family oxidoreductase [Amycolatopsis sp.]
MDKPVLVDRTVIVTGAGSGIGRAVAVGATRAGAGVALVGRRESALRATAEDCEAVGGKVLVVVADLAERAAAGRVVAETVDRFGGLYGLVNNAAVATLGGIEDVDDDAVEAMFAVNAIAPIRLLRAALPELRRAEGAVVNIGSASGRNSSPRAIAYGATKAALLHQTRSAAKLLAADRVRVNAVSPGVVVTPIWGGVGLAPDVVEERLDSLRAATPVGRLAEPEEIARWVLALLDSRSGFVTGTILDVDGGLSA